jgi:hypothetical protein
MIISSAAPDLSAERVTLPPVRDLGDGFKVRRALPSAQRRSRANIYKMLDASNALGGVGRITFKMSTPSLETAEMKRPRGTGKMMMTASGCRRGLAPNLH